MRSMHGTSEEERFAFDLENPRDRGTGTRFDFMVRIDKAHAQLAGELATYGRLARPHQSYQIHILHLHVS